MLQSSLRRFALPAIALTVVLSLVAAAPASAGTIRTRGTGTSVDVSWTEYDPDNLLGLPGNVHIGYLYASSDMYGTYFYGNVTDFECDPGEVPWGAHGVIHEQIIDDAADTVEDAIDGVVDDVIDSSNGLIDADVVIDNIQNDLSENIPALIEEEFDKIPACDYIQDRFLEGENAVFSVDTKAGIATISGNLTVSTGGHGHGEVGQVLGTPPVNITISGGEWNKFSSDYTSRGVDYFYSSSHDGTGYYGGTVTGGIGAMGFADDADDESYGGFSSYRYRSVERVR